MKYRRTVNLWAPSVQQQICGGKLKLQTGQWCVCGDSEKKCRFVSASSVSINVVHWQGSAKSTRELFQARLNVTK